MFLRCKRVLSCIIICVILLVSNAYALDLSARSAVVIDRLSGKVIYAKNAESKMSMASTTKIMTAICALENGNLSDVVKVHPSAVGVEGSSMYLGHGEEITLENLVYGLMLASGNDAAVAIAMHISGSVDEFAKLMNQTANKIGAVNTQFKNPNGLDAEGHYTTAHDLALITRYGLENVNGFADIVKTYEKKMPWQGKDYDRVLHNHNKLLRIYEGCDGVKTGFTKKSGRCLVSSATRDNLGVIAVTLNAPNDWDDHAKMLDYAFQSYSVKKVITKGEYIGTVNVARGMDDKVSLIAGEDVYATVKNGENPDVKIEYDIPTEIKAPVGFEKIAGKVIVSWDGFSKSINAVTKAYVPEKNDTYIDKIRKIILSWIRII